MQRKKTTWIFTGALVIAAGLMASGPAAADSFEVSITNLTRGQIISPPVVIVHDDNFKLFQLGAPASDELAALAEDALTDDLVAALMADPAVEDFELAGSGIMPGETITVGVSGLGQAKLLSAAGMLVSTNDAFFAVNGMRLPNVGGGPLSLRAVAYDAGSEVNSEDCAFIPGPPCGNPEMRDTVGAEGFVHVHAGIHGIAGAGNLVAADHDWRNPVALVTVRRTAGD